jgi:hypothetical protein
LGPAATAPLVGAIHKGMVGKSLAAASHEPVRSAAAKAVDHVGVLLVAGDTSAWTSSAEVMSEHLPHAAD